MSSAASKKETDVKQTTDNHQPSQPTNDHNQQVWKPEDATVIWAVNVCQLTYIYYLAMSQAMILWWMATDHVAYAELCSPGIKV